MKPPFSYFGGKTRLAPWIVSLLPPHRVYIEPFAGSLAVFFAKAPAIHEVINDVDGEVVAFFKALRDQPDELLRAVRLTPYARAEFQACKAEESIDNVERARRFWVRVNQSFNKSARLDNGFSASVACQNGEAKTVINRADRLLAAAERLSGAIIEQRDAAEVVSAFATPDSVIYADPPYVGVTRGQDRAYVHEMTDDDHRRLAAALHDSPATVVLSGYESALYDELYEDWHRLDQSVLRRSSNRAQGERPRATEVIWSNRPLDEGRLFGTSDSGQRTALVGGGNGPESAAHPDAVRGL